jgi:hypothetical protein
VLDRDRVSTAFDLTAVEAPGSADRVDPRDLDPVDLV